MPDPPLPCFRVRRSRPLAFSTPCTAAGEGVPFSTRDRPLLHTKVPTEIVLFNVEQQMKKCGLLFTYKEKRTCSSDVSALPAVAG